MSGSLKTCAFETAIGRCAIIWNNASIMGFQLPEADARALELTTRTRFVDVTVEQPPAWIQEIIGRVQRHLCGDPDSFGDIPLAYGGHPPFHQRVYAEVRGIAPGRTMTYGEVATMVGRPGAARAVGQAMRRNPLPLFVPCHRVLAAGAKPGGFSAHGGVATKAAMLLIEGVDDAIEACRSRS